MGQAAALEPGPTPDDRMMVPEKNRRLSDRFPERWQGAAVLALFVVLAVTYSLITPIFEGFDEPFHYAYVHHVATGQGLPRQPAEQYPHLAHQEANQPPLYYFLVSVVTRWVPGDDLAAFLRLNPHFAPVPWGYPDNQNYIVHTDDERWPYSGTALAVHLARGISILLGAGTVYATFVLARLLFPGEGSLALGAMLVTALTPGFLFSSALVSNDALIIFLSSWTLVLVARIWKGGARRWDPLLLGLLLGSAALTKLSGLLLWPFAALVLLLLACRQRSGRLLTHVAVPALLLAASICGWWYIRNGQLYGDPTGIGAMLDAIGRREPGFGLRDVWAEFSGIRWSYWAVFGWFNLTLPAWLYRVYDLVAILAAVGLGLYGVRALRRGHAQGLLGILFLSVWLLAMIVSLVRWTLLTPGSQGRLLYPAIGAVSVLFTRGVLALAALWPGRPRRLAVGLVGVLFGVAVYVPLCIIGPAYALPPLLSAEEVDAQIAESLEVQFEDSITLLGYRLDVEEVEAGDLFWVTACWQGDRAINEEYRVFVQLLVENDLIAAQKDTYHGLGNFPTSLWPAGARFCDRYPLRVSDTVPHSGPGEIAIGLYRGGGQRLVIVSPEDQAEGDHVRLPGPRVQVDPNRSLAYDWGHQVALVNYSLDKTAAAPGDQIRLELAWRALRTLDTDYVATVQILSPQNTKIGQSDLPLSTSAWQPGEIVRDVRTLDLALDARPWVYEIKVGLYDPKTVENLTLYRHHLVQPGGGLLTLWTLRVLPLGE
jgi:hypothetical protein